MGSHDTAFAAFLEELEKQSLPPVQSWRPVVVRDMDLVIDARGEWYYQGTKFERLDLVRLLSKVLVRQHDQYFLVSPAEKLRITVEDVPFVATDFEIDESGRERRLIFDTNVGFKVPLDCDHPMFLRPSANRDERIPYLVVRDDLEARVARSVFYRLVELGEQRDRDGDSFFGIASAGRFFSLGPVNW